MRFFNKFALAALLASGAVIGASAPANARVDVSIGVGGPGVFVGDYDYYRPCSYYRYWNIPAPARCYREFYGFYGPSVFVVDGFVFSNRDSWGRWRDRDDYGHWRRHEWRRADWHDHDNGWHNGWRDHDHDWHDHDHDWHDHDGDHHDHDHDWHDHDHDH